MKNLIFALLLLPSIASAGGASKEYNDLYNCVLGKARTVPGLTQHDFPISAYALIGLCDKQVQASIAELSKNRPDLSHENAVGAVANIIQMMLVDFGI